MTKNDAPESEAGRPMSEDELEAAGYPRNFHKLSPEDRARLEAQIRDEVVAGDPGGEPPQTPDGDGPPPQYREAVRRAHLRLFSAATGSPPTPEQRTRVGVLQEAAREFATVIELLVPPGRDQSIALTAVEDALMRANRGLFVPVVEGGALALIDVSMQD